MGFARDGGPEREGESKRRVFPNCGFSGIGGGAEREESLFRAEVKEPKSLIFFRAMGLSELEGAEGDGKNRFSRNKGKTD